MGQVLQWGLLQGREPVGVAGLWGWRLVSTISWRRFAESDRRRFDKILGGWIRGEDVEAFSKDPRKTTMIYPKVYHFRFVSSLYVLVMLTHRPDDAIVCLRYVPLSWAARQVN